MNNPDLILADGTTHSEFCRDFLIPLRYRAKTSDCGEVGDFCLPFNNNNIALTVLPWLGHSHKGLVLKDTSRPVLRFFPIVLDTEGYWVHESYNLSVLPLNIHPDDFLQSKSCQSVSHEIPYFIKYPSGQVAGFMTLHVGTAPGGKGHHLKFSNTYSAKLYRLLCDICTPGGAA